MRKDSADIDATISIRCCLDSIMRMVQEGHSFPVAINYHMEESNKILEIAGLINPKTKEFYP